MREHKADKRVRRTLHTLFHRPQYAGAGIFCLLGQLIPVELPGSTALFVVPLLPTHDSRELALVSMLWVNAETVLARSKEHGHASRFIALP